MAEPLFKRRTGPAEEEALYSRDVKGYLVRDVPATAADYEMDIPLTIDGNPCTVKKARPSRDALGNLIIDANGQTLPRKTTIYDAAIECFGPGDAMPIPVLCHQEHVKPAAVCRLCTVEVRRKGRGGKEETALVPACHEPVKDGMAVHTMGSPDAAVADAVRGRVRVLVELLGGDRLIPDEKRDPHDSNELVLLANRVGADLRKYSPRERKRQELDESSPLMTIDPNSCVLCNRCIRACNEVKGNHVLGRGGKGYDSYIAFDLGVAIFQSSCVSCGECMVSCPTDAMTFRAPVESSWRGELLGRKGYYAVSGDMLREQELFRGFSRKYLQWNEGAVVGRNVERGDVLCRAGEYGSTAFLLSSGSYGIWLGTPDVVEGKSKQGFLSRFLGRSKSNGDGQTQADDRIRVESLGEPDRICGPEDRILGEMTCLNDLPRNATVVALEAGEIYIIRRNVLAMLERNQYSREILEQGYTKRALDSFLRHVPLFKGLSDAERASCRTFLTGRISLARVRPGQMIFEEGDLPDAFYLLFDGHVKVSVKTVSGTDQVIQYYGPGSYFGEMSLLPDKEGRALVEGDDPVRRNATCTALSEVELITLAKDDFRALVSSQSGLEERFLQMVKKRKALERDLDPVQRELLKNFVDQGLYSAQKMLVIDLEACTRCDECTKACASTHDGVTRMVRDGLRIGNYLVASACRSCSEPYCLVGCPVDAIHRRRSLEIHIENHCIGCGTCATNCPYGNINMVSVPVAEDDPIRMLAEVRQKATACDLCSDVPKGSTGEVTCVHACPHEAAFRMDGETLWKRLSLESAR